MERMMSIPNLHVGFQSIGLVRSEMSEPAEAALKNCNSIALLRKEGEPFKDEIAKSLDSTISLLSDVISRLQLKRKSFRSMTAALVRISTTSGRFYSCLSLFLREMKLERKTLRTKMV